MKEFVKKHRIPIIVTAFLVVTALIVTGVLLVTKPRTTKDANSDGITTSENGTTTDENTTTSDSGEKITTKEWIIMFAEKFGLSSYMNEGPYFENIKADSNIFSYVQTMVENDILDVASESLKLDEEISQKSALIQLAKIYGETYIENRLEKENLTDDDYIKFATENIGLSLNAVEEGFSFSEATEAIDMTWEHYLAKEYGNFHKVDYTENVIDLSMVEDYVYESDTILISTEEEITEGKILILATQDEYKSLIAFKVTAVENDGNNYILDVTEPTLDDIVVAMNIEFSQIANWDDFIPAEGVTVLDGKNVAASGSFDHTGSEKTFEVNFTDKKLTYSDEWEDIYGKLTLNGISTKNVNYFKDSKGNMMSKYKEGVEIVGKITIKDLIIKGYAEYDGNLEFNVEAGATISSSLSIKGKKEEQMIRVGELPIYTFGSPFSFVVDVYVVATMEGEIKVEPKVTAIASAKKTKNSGVNFTGDITTSDLNSTISGKVKLAVCPDAVVCIYGLADLMDLYIEAGVGSDAKYDLKDPGKIKIEIYAPTLKAGVGKDKKSILSGVLGIKYDVKIMDKKDALFKCPYIEELVFDVPAIIDFITGEETTTEAPTKPEIPTEPITEAPKPTEPVTKPPTQKPTEAPKPTEPALQKPTEKPTETPTEAPTQSLNVVASGCTYYVAATGVTLTVGEEMPSTPQCGDKYETKDYTYVYDNKIAIGCEMISRAEGWNPIVKDCGKTTYENILTTIAGKKISTLITTFSGCTNLITAPIIPSSVTDMSNAFMGCSSLKTAPTIPPSVTMMKYTFSSCTSLTIAPTIPSSVTDMRGTFNGCTNLTTAPVIPSSVIDMAHTFSGCTSLTTAPVIPSNVTVMTATFCGCISLSKAPIIPSGVTMMNSTFNGCTNLTTAPVIPSSVIDMAHTFSGCTSLTGTIIINTNTEYNYFCFNGVDFVMQNITLTGSSTMLEELRATASNY